ncbi:MULTISPECIES: hypothetical protein [unclassified Microcoleus]|uniref:hypothetical protein n=1 Tax=unclassified Microcoleus TaxID=2642155 RepID=UPI002FD3B939
MAALILNELWQPNLAVVEPSDTWTEEDCLDVTTFSLQYAATIVHSDPDILGGNSCLYRYSRPDENSA